MISHHHQSSFDDHHRFLIAKTMGGAASPMMLAWYCFIGFITLPILGCMFYCWWSRRQSHLRAQQAAQDEEELERMEANIRTFAAMEKTQRSQIIRRAIRKHVLRLSEEDILCSATDRETTIVDDAHTDIHTITSSIAPSTRNSSNNKAWMLQKSLADQGCCSVCLETFRAGERVAHSICHHLFHEDCIVSWFASQSLDQGQQQCPCCRQPFALAEEEEGTIGSSSTPSARPITQPSATLSSSPLEVEADTESFSSSSSTSSDDVETVRASPPRPQDGDDTSDACSSSAQSQEEDPPPV